MFQKATPQDLKVQASALAQDLGILRLVDAPCQPKTHPGNEKLSINVSGWQPPRLPPTFVTKALGQTAPMSAFGWPIDMPNALIPDYAHAICSLSIAAND